MDYQAHCRSRGRQLDHTAWCCGREASASGLFQDGRTPSAQVAACVAECMWWPAASRWGCPGVTEACEATGHLRHSVHMPNAQSRECWPCPAVGRGCQACAASSGRGRRFRAPGSACHSPRGLQHVAVTVESLQNGHMVDMVRRQRPE